MTRNLVVIGLGLIGGSLAASAKKRHLCERVLGVARRDDVCERAVELGIVDQATTRLDTLAPLLGAGDVIFIAVPTLTVGSVLEDIKRCIKNDVTITDGASVKGSVAADVRRIWGSIPANVVLGHPIAGSEQSGVEAANPDLYEQHRVILTPTPETGAQHLARVTELWRKVGAEVLNLSIEDHDEILAATSHLPHVIAYSLVDTLAHDSQNQNIFRYAAGGFRDFTRIASSDAIMWRDIMLANKSAILHAIDMFSGNLATLRSAIEQEDAKALTGVFSRAKAARDHFTSMLAKRAYSKYAEYNASYKIRYSGPLNAQIVVPGDKSISHRAIILGAIAEGVTTVQGFSESEDALASIQAFRDLGVVIEGPHHGEVKVFGVGKYGLSKPVGPLYIGSSGTSLRLLTGLMAAQPFPVEITGDRAINTRRVARLVEPLQKMGAVIETSAADTPPVKIAASPELMAIDYALPVASAQTKSAILLAGLYVSGQIRITEPEVTRDHTERMLRHFGIDLSFGDGAVMMDGGQSLLADHLVVPGDFSAAIFPICACLLAPESAITIRQVGVNPTRAGVLSLLQRMGANISLLNETEQGGEPVADIDVRYSDLQSVCFSQDDICAMQEEFVYILVLAALTNGTTRFAGIYHGSGKEHERLENLLLGFQQLGLPYNREGDDLVVEGSTPTNFEVDCAGDPRIMLAFSLVGCVQSDGIILTNCGAVEQIFPSFAQLFIRLGISIDVFNS